MLLEGKEAESKFLVMIYNIYRVQRSCGKVMFSQASVILFTVGGGHVSQHALIRHPSTGQTPPPRQTLPWADTSLPSACWDTPTPPSACWDTPPPRRPLQRTVRTLLECILVMYENRFHIDQRFVVLKIE